jgi:hypothetical protein
MASPVIVYFAGIGTVVAALSIGFGSALMLTATKPVQKEPAAAYAKRDQPVIEPQAAPVVAVAPAQATEASDPLEGLAPPMTALPVPRADTVTRALALNPPPADTSAAPAPQPQPVQVRPVQPPKLATPPEDTSALRIREPQKAKDIVAAERKVIERKQLSDENRKVEVEEQQESPEPPRLSAEPDRPTREGF